MTNAPGEDRSALEAFEDFPTEQPETGPMSSVQSVVDLDTGNPVVVGPAGLGGGHRRPGRDPGHGSSVHHRGGRAWSEAAFVKLARDQGLDDGARSYPNALYARY